MRKRNRLLKIVKQELAGYSFFFFFLSVSLWKSRLQQQITSARGKWSSLRKVKVRLVVCGCWEKAGIWRVVLHLRWAQADHIDARRGMGLADWEADLIFGRARKKKEFERHSLPCPHFSFHLVVTDIPSNIFIIKSICQTILTLSRCVTLSKLLVLSEPRYPCF